MDTSAAEDAMLINRAFADTPPNMLCRMEWRVSEKRLKRLASAFGLANVVDNILDQALTMYGRPIRLSEIDEIALVLVVKPAPTESGGSSHP